MYSYTVCFVLTDDDKLEYYNELLISLCSLRKREFDGTVIILTDDKTVAEIEGQNCTDYKEFQAELRIIKTPESYSQKENSRFIKTSMREYISGDFLYLDTDTIVVEPLPLEFDGELALAIDFNTDLKNRADYDIRFLFELNKRGGYKVDMDRPYYNSGCIWSRDTAKTHDFFAAGMMNGGAAGIGALSLAKCP